MRKVNVVLFVIIFVAVFTGVMSEGAVDHKDELFDLIKKSNVTIRDRPVVENNTKCGKEWGIFGSYCEFKSLSEFARKDEEAIDTAIQDYLMYIPEIVNLFLKIIRYSIEFSKANERLYFNIKSPQNKSGPTDNKTIAIDSDRKNLFRGEISIENQFSEGHNGE